MTALLIDIGNTRVKWARATPQLHVEYCPHGGEPEHHLRNLAGVSGAAVIVAHVFGRDRDAPLRTALQDAGAQSVHIAHTAKARDGLSLAYAEPERLGVDRFLAMLALWQQHRSGFLVASAGTAMTVDVVDNDGHHLGGYIAPGLHLMRQAVLDGTRFPHAIDAPFEGRPGDSTESCVAEAALLACSGMLDAAADRHPRVAFLCGGDASILLPHLRSAWQLREHLVLEGLRGLVDASP